MDLLRSCYSTIMQFDQAGTIFAPVVWYFAPPGAKPFPVANLFASQNWDTEKYAGVGPGEVWFETQTWSNGALPAPFTGQGPPCAPLDWWQNGVPTGTPPLQLDGRGVPLCCSVVVPYSTSIEYDQTGSQNQCQAWNTAAPTSGRSVVNLTLSQTGIITTNTATSFIAHFTTSPTITFNASNSGSCLGQQGTSATLRQGATIGTLALQSYNTSTGVAVYKSIGAVLFPGQFFRFTLPH